MTGKLNIRVDKGLDGYTVRDAVPVRIRRIQSLGDSGVQSDLPLVAVPATHDQRVVKEVELPEGFYELEAVLPSGEIRIAEAKIIDGGATDVVFEGVHSANEWRSWAHFAGARDASPTAKGGPIEPDLLNPSRQPHFRIKLGSRAGEGLNPSSWWDWYTYLLKRWESRNRDSLREFDPEMQDELVAPNDLFDLDIKTVDAAAGEPARVVIRSVGQSVPSKLIGTRRKFLSVSSVRGTRVISVPLPWNGDPLPWNYNAQRAFLPPHFEVLISETDEELLCDPVLVDEQYGGVLAYLNAGRIGLASELLKRTAYRALFDKFENPLAAAAGGYVLLSTMESGNDNGEWTNWLGNLAARFPGIPDGPILRAHWLLFRGGAANREEAHLLLVESIDRGIPFFTAGTVWLIDGLRQTSIDMPERQQLCQMVRGVARSMDLSRGLTSFTLAAPEETGGALPARHRSDLVPEAATYILESPKHVTMTG